MDKYRGSLAELAADGKERPKPGVKEVVMLQCCSAIGESYMIAADIVRKAGEMPVLESWERMENHRSQGRFIFDAVPVTERQ